ncbi:MAG TPA: S8 family serine peptidase [Candidatus Polarisedimenticolaceae bacterium]
MPRPAVLAPLLLAFASEVPAAGPPRHADGWFLIQLDRALTGESPDGAFPLRTGVPALDAAIRETPVRWIDFAFRVSLADASLRDRHAAAGLDRVYRFHVPRGTDVAAAVARFAAIPGVSFAEPDWVGEGGTLPNDPSFSSQWAYQQVSDNDVDGPEAWDVAVGGPQIVAVLDTGADSDHPDLAAKLLAGWDFANNDADPEDDHGHGTNVGSIASAVTNNGAGVAGACWNCRILPLKVLDATNSGLYSWWADAMIWATDHGARVLNLSAGGFSASSTLLNGVQYAWKAGVVHVSITHNDNCNCIRYPGRYAETIAVGGTDGQDRRAVPFCYNATSGSNYGAEIDVVAPGELILGAARGGGYSSWCGTSQAAPLVAGLVGVVRSMNPALGREEARHLLRASAEDLQGRPAEDVAGFDIYHGWGRVNMDRAVRAARSTISLRVEGKAATRVRLDAANPVAASYDFIRGDLASLTESDAGVTTGSVVCLENDSPDPDTAGREDTGTPAPGTGYFYLSRFTGAPGAGRYGGSSRNRDRTDPSAGDCPR